MTQRVSRRDEDDRPADGEIDLRALGRGLWRRKLWILLPTLLAAVLAFAFVQLSDPYYRSSALLLIENREPAIPRPGAEREQPLPDEQAVATQVQLIQSRDLIRKVVQSLNLAQDPEFEAGKASLLHRLLAPIGLAGTQANLPLSEQMVDKVAEQLTVYPVSGSRVVGIEFVSKSPDVAARIVNGFVDAYLDIQRDAKRDVNRQASQYLSDEISGLRGRVAEAEDRVEAFRVKAGLLVGTNNTTIAAQQLGDTTIQLSSARTQQAEARAKADLIRDVLRQGRPAEALDIANSELVRALAQQRSQLAAQIASEGRTLLPQHPRMRELSAQLSGLDGQIRIEAEKLARAFENEAKTAGARVAELERRMEGLKTAAGAANGQDVQLRALEREARSQRDLLEQMLARYREASARDNPEALLADARVISRAAAPSEPYFPKKGPTIALATLAAFALALFAAAAAEIFGGGRRPENGDAAPPPAVGEVPVFGRLHGPTVVGRNADARAAAAPNPMMETVAPAAAAPNPAAATPLATAASVVAGAEPARPAHAVARPHARSAAIEFADANLVAALARQLAAMPTDGGALRILATGAALGLGVAAVANKLAHTLSDSGRRVVAVDAGGGAPEAADGLDRPGLSDLLSGSATFSEAIHRDRGSRVHVVPQGAARFSALDAAAQARLGTVLDALALTYDFVMLTAPSGAGKSDFAAAHCSAAILVSHAGAGDPATVEAHERLTAAGIEDVVVLLVGDGDGAPRDRSLAAA